MQMLLSIDSTTADAQVRSAYRKKGWAFTDPQGIEQCAQEGFSKALQEQAGEGCHMWGAISINKVGGSRTRPACHELLCWLPTSNLSCKTMSLSVLCNAL